MPWHAACKHVYTCAYIYIYTGLHCCLCLMQRSCAADSRVNSELITTSNISPHLYLIAPFRSHDSLVGQCAADSDCGTRSYCSSKKVCTKFRHDLCNTDSCGLGDGGSYGCVGFGVIAKGGVWGACGIGVFAKAGSALANRLIGRKSLTLSLTLS